LDEILNVQLQYLSSLKIFLSAGFCTATPGCKSAASILDEILNIQLQYLSSLKIFLSAGFCAATPGFKSAVPQQPASSPSLRGSDHKFPSINATKGIAAGHYKKMAKTRNLFNNSRSLRVTSFL